MKNKKENHVSLKRKAAVYVIVGILTFTMVFSVFATLISFVR